MIVIGGAFASVRAGGAAALFGRNGADSLPAFTDENILHRGVSDQAGWSRRR